MVQSSYLLVDLRGYTRFIDNEPLPIVIAAINRYYKIIEQIASGLEGAFCSALGDATGTWFTGNQHATRAVKAAAKILMILRRRNFPLIAAAGIDSGQIIPRRIKTPNMRIILPVGRPVAAAYHLEDLAAIYNCDIIISGDTFNLLSHESRRLFHFLESRRLKGIDQRFTIYGAQIA